MTKWDHDASGCKRIKASNIADPTPNLQSARDHWNYLEMLMSYHDHACRATVWVQPYEADSRFYLLLYNYKYVSTYENKSNTNKWRWWWWLMSLQVHLLLSEYLKTVAHLFHKFFSYEVLWMCDSSDCI
jgi:hypothetical protein